MCSEAPYWAPEDGEDELGLPEPHPEMPKATARKGTRRMAPEVRAAVGPLLTRTRGMELMASGALEAGKCQIVWNVKDRAVSHPVSQVQVPDPVRLRPVRRIGTYKGAEGRIAMYPVMRGGAVTMLELESQLELHHAIDLSIRPNVTDILAQPFLMLWRHKEGALVQVPDLAAKVDGRLTVFAVKPDQRASEERTRVVFEFVAEALRCGHVDFRVLGSMSKQRQVNLARLARYREPVPIMSALLAMVRPQRPRTIGGVYGIVRRHLGFGDLDLPSPECPSLIGLDVAMYALAQGVTTADLDKPMQLSTSLTWSDDRDGALR